MASGSETRCYIMSAEATAARQSQDVAAEMAMELDQAKQAAESALAAAEFELSGGS